MERSGKPRKAFEADILENWIKAQKEQRQAPRPLKGRMPRVTPMQSSRQRKALRQTNDAVRAAYQPEHKLNATPVRPDDRGLTREVGPNDKHNDKDYRAGKDTAERAPEQGKLKRPAPTKQKQSQPKSRMPSLAEFIANEGRF